MKAFITLCHKNHAYDGTLTHLFRAFEKTSLQECDVVIFPITYQDSYVADEELMKAIAESGKKIVIVDFVEYGWDARDTDHFFGVNTESPKFQNKFKNEDYIKLCDFCYDNTESIILYFKRELSSNRKVEGPFKTLPIEYPGIATLPDTKIDSFEEYNNRPIDLMMVWGLSNPSRPILHGELCKQAGVNGWQLVTDLRHIAQYQIEGRNKMCVMVMNPDFARESIHTILHLQSLAKISISMNGAGKKCFRHSESSYNSVMALQETGLEWTYPWIDYENAIVLPNRDNTDKAGLPLIDESLAYQKLMMNIGEPERLYKMYLNGIDNWNNYEVNKYSEFILKEIQNAI